MYRFTIRLKLFTLAAALLVVGALPATVFALEQPAFGGNNASDYQPPTGNPQTGNPTSLQPTSSALQPVTLLNQQALIQSGALSVLTAPDKGATSTGQEPSTVKKPKSSLPIWIIGGLLTLIAVAYVVFKPDQKDGEPEPSEATAPLAVQPEKPATKKVTKKKTKKPTGRKSKSTRR